MTQQDQGKSTRTWQQIAEEASRETDSEKLIKLTEELALALDAQTATGVDGKSYSDIPAGELDAFANEMLAHAARTESTDRKTTAE